MGAIIGTYIFVTLIIIAILVVLYFIFRRLEFSKGKIGFYLILITIILLVLVFIFSKLYFGSQTGRRLLKDIESNYDGGITRTVKVYTENGDLIYEDTGKFDIEVSDTKLKYINEDGKVQIVYLGNSGIAVVNEID